MSSKTSSKSILTRPLRLPCGVTLPNRIAKSAMTEGVADELNKATRAHVNLYKKWSTGCGMLITGNVQIDRRYMERAGNVAIDGVQDDTGLRGLREYALAATSNGNTCFMQIGHAGRQCDTRVNTSPVGPSDIPVKVKTRPVYATRALTKSEIKELTRKFAYAAKVAKETGFTGVQLHSAHGYLLSSFLSPLANQRKDEYGGTLKNRCRFLMETIAAVRREVGTDYPIAVKLNSADFQRGGFTHEEAIQVARWLDQQSLDLLEISGGNYENPVLLLGTGGDEEKKKTSTELREAYFLKYAKDIKGAMKNTPLMVTGGFRTRSVMEAAIQDGFCDVVGVARPLCGDPKCVDRLLNGEIDSLPSWEETIKAPWFLEKLSGYVRLLRVAKLGLGLQSWCYVQLIRMSNDQEPDLKKSLYSCMTEMGAFEEKKASSLKGLDKISGTSLNKKASSSFFSSWL